MTTPLTYSLTDSYGRGIQPSEQGSQMQHFADVVFTEGGLHRPGPAPRGRCRGRHRRPHQAVVPSAGPTPGRAAHARGGPPRRLLTPSFQEIPRPPGLRRRRTAPMPPGGAEQRRGRRRLIAEYAGPTPACPGSSGGLVHGPLPRRRPVPAPDRRRRPGPAGRALQPRPSQPVGQHGRAAGGRHRRRDDRPGGRAHWQRDAEGTATGTLARGCCGTGPCRQPGVRRRADLPGAAARQEELWPWASRAGKDAIVWDLGASEHRGGV